MSPACRSVDDLATHLIAYLEQIPERPPSLGAAIKLGDTAPGRTARQGHGRGRAPHGASVHRRGIAACALSGTASLWRHGIATVDLLGEATVTPAEADRYAERHREALETPRRGGGDVPERGRGSSVTPWDWFRG